MSTNLELKPCPFCGKGAETRFTNQHDKLYVVGCNTLMCYANINNFVMVFRSKENAIKSWNTRKEPIPSGKITV